MQKVLQHGISLMASETTELDNLEAEAFVGKSASKDIEMECCMYCFQCYFGCLGLNSLKMALKTDLFKQAYSQ